MSTLKIRERFHKLMADCLTDSEYKAAKGPFTYSVSFHDGPFLALFNKDGKPFLCDGIRDPEDAAVLIKTFKAKKKVRLDIRRNYE